MIVTNEYKDDSFHVLCGVRPFKGEAQSGDGVVLVRGEDSILVGIIDGLGHGEKAVKITTEVKEYLEKIAEGMPLDKVLENAHQVFMGSQGVCLALARVFNNGSAEYAGLGNVAAKVLTWGRETETFLIPRDGALGVRCRNIERTLWSMKYEDVVVFYSDGISEKIARSNPSLFNINTLISIQQIIERFGTEDDDVSFLVLKYLSC